MKTRLSLGVIILILVGILTIASSANAGLINTSGTINPSLRLIEIFGTIDVEDTRIDLTLIADSGDIPAGIWTILKHETNATPESWGAWEMLLDPATITANLPGTFSSDKFAQVAVFSDRITFHDGVVMSGEILNKSFEVELLTPGGLLLSHSRRPKPSEVTLDAIQNGFPPAPNTVTANIILQTIPEPSTYLLFVVGILGIIGMGYRQRKKAAQG